jgi:hypothetical protein
MRIAKQERSNLHACLHLFILELYFIKKILGILGFAANWVAELELGRDSRSGKVDEYIGEILAEEFSDGQG